MLKQINSNERWLVNFYQLLETSGAEFFALLSQSTCVARVQIELTNYFSDKSNHAWLWMQIQADLGYEMASADVSYLNAYLDAAELPSNSLDALAMAYIFQKRAAKMYATHLRLEHISPAVKNTINDILVDDLSHLRRIANGLKRMAAVLGKNTIQTTLTRYNSLDERVFATFLREYDEQLDFIQAGEKIANYDGALIAIR